MQRLDFTTELERVITRGWQNELREVIAEVDDGMRDLRLALDRLYYGWFQPSPFVPECMR